MEVLIPLYYEQFECVGDKCRDTCCKGWRIIVDELTYEKYNMVEGEFGEKLKNSILEKEDGYDFILDNGKCPFLDKYGLCDIYNNLGKDALCETCKQYPRMPILFPDSIEGNLTLSCPEVARIIISSKEPIAFRLLNNDDPVEQHAEYELFCAIRNARNLSIDIVQTREISLWKRQIIVMMLAEKVQNCIESNDAERINKLVEEYSDINVIFDLIKGLNDIQMNSKVRAYMILTLLNEMRSLMSVSSKFQENLERIYEKFQGKLIDEIVEFLNESETRFDEYYRERSYELEHYMVYHIYRYYLSSFHTKNLFRDMNIMNLSYVIIKLFAVMKWLDNKNELEVEDMADIMASCSKTLEHNTAIYDMVYELLEKKGYTSLAYKAMLVRDRL